jgi:hypothetical protein
MARLGMSRKREIKNEHHILVGEPKAKRPRRIILKLISEK